jgi:hypothetical protein
VEADMQRFVKVVKDGVEVIREAVVDDMGGGMVRLWPRLEEGEVVVLTKVGEVVVAEGGWCED